MMAGVVSLVAATVYDHGGMNELRISSVRILVCRKGMIYRTSRDTLGHCGQDIVQETLLLCLRV
jgi:hypothetical protein